MASIVSAGTTSGTSLNLSGDTSGVLQLATNGTTTAVTIDTSQNVGIGTSSPTTKLGVNGAAQFIGVSPALFPTTGSGIEIVGGVAGQQNYIQAYNRTGSTWQNLDIASGLTTFSVSGAERMRIDSSGNLLVGKTTSSDSTAGTLIAPTYIFATRDGFAPLNLRRLTNSGPIAEFYSGTGGNSVGNISVASTGITYTGTNGITFTANQTASSDVNTLDDYEEGTWTPVVNGVNLGAVGRYTKIGRLVNISFANQTGVTGFAVNAEVNCTGVPFSIVGGDWSNTAPVVFCWNRAVDGYSSQLGTGRIQNSGTIALANKGAASTTTSDPLNMSLTYFTT
jgi:hypothetical protein